MRAYSSDLRDRVLADCDAGLTTTVVARKFSVSTAWIRRLKQRRASGRGIQPTPHRHGPRPSWQAHADRIRVAVHQQPDLTLREYIERFALPLSKSALARGLAALGLCRKKSRCTPASKTART